MLVKGTLAFSLTIGADTVCSNFNPADVQQIYNCSRTGFDVIEITGENFGPAGATVFVGSQECTVVAAPASLVPPPSPHTTIFCSLPPGNAIDIAVVVLQHNGQLSLRSKAAVSYSQCAPGTAQSGSNGLECAPCLSGTCLLRVILTEGYFRHIQQRLCRSSMQCLRYALRFSHCAHRLFRAAPGTFALISGEKRIVFDLFFFTLFVTRVRRANLSAVSVRWR